MERPTAETGRPFRGRFGCAASGTMLAKSGAMDSRQTSGRQGNVCRPASSLAVDETSAEQVRRRAARWHAWLKSPECTFQDRENFERWCADVANAAAYVAFCGDLAGVPELADGGEASSYEAHVFASFVRSPRLEVDQR